MLSTSLEAQSSCDIIAIRNGTGAGPAGISSPRGCEVRSAALAGSAIDHRLPIAIPDPFLADILKPYRAHARYLRSAEITHFRNPAAPRDGTSAASLLTGTGRFSIPESCYIDDTGHFNAVARYHFGIRRLHQAARPRHRQLRHHGDLRGGRRRCEMA